MEKKKINYLTKKGECSIMALMNKFNFMSLFDNSISNTREGKIKEISKIRKKLDKLLVELKELWRQEFEDE